MRESVVPYTGTSAGYRVAASPLDAADRAHLPNYSLSGMLLLSNQISAPPRGVEGTQTRRLTNQTIWQNGWLRTILSHFADGTKAAATLRGGRPLFLLLTIAKVVIKDAQGALSHQQKRTPVCRPIR